MLVADKNQQEPNMIESDAYNALTSRDLRFDGVFFVGITDNLLPADLPGEDADAEKLPFL
jgi:hypothetical protein